MLSSMSVTDNLRHSFAHSHSMSQAWCRAWCVALPTRSRISSAGCARSDKRSRRPDRRLLLIRSASDGPGHLTPARVFSQLTRRLLSDFVLARSCASAAHAAAPRSASDKRDELRSGRALVSPTCCSPQSALRLVDATFWQFILAHNWQSCDRNRASAVVTATRRSCSHRLLACFRLARVTQRRPAARASRVIALSISPLARTSLCTHAAKLRNCEALAKQCLHGPAVNCPTSVPLHCWFVARCT